MQNRPPFIETPRLQLVALLAEEIRALIAGNTSVAASSAGLVFPTGWPEDRDARDGLPWHLGHLERDVTHSAWRVRVVVDRASSLVVGSINLKGPPNDEGDVEIGWGIDPSVRGRGYASEAAAAVARWASAQAGFTSISATIPDDNLPSQRVAARLGMVRTHEMRRELPLWRRTSLAG